mgnify:FL=1
MFEWVGKIAIIIAVLWLYVLSVFMIASVDTPLLPNSTRQMDNSRTFLECRHAFDRRLPTFPHVSVVHGVDMKYCTEEVKP